MNQGVLVPPSNSPFPIKLEADSCECCGSRALYTEEESLFAWQRFDAEGTPQGQRRSTPSDSRDRPTGAVTRAGRFLLFP